MVDAHAAPAACAGFVRAASRTHGWGCAGQLPEAPVDARTIFDLASVSKPVVACTLMRLAKGRLLELEAPLGSLLPQARGTRSESLPLELFLAHRAGLEPHLALYAPLIAGRALRRDEALSMAANARRADCTGMPDAQGFAPLYSDLGYLLLGAVIEQVTRAALDSQVASEVSEPLGIQLGSARQWRSRRATFDRDVAPTETVVARGGQLRGIVHDENAWALAGHGTAGHAGLFGTIADVLGFGAALLDALDGRSHWLSRAALQTLVRPRAGGTLRAGFDSKSRGVSSAGELCGAETFGHLGFTGTSLWCDPGAGIATVLLTNRVCPTRDNPRIRAARPAVHDALFHAGRAVLPMPPDP